MTPITFSSAENMSIFWGYVKMLLSGVAPWIMISVALAGVGMLLVIVIKAWKQSAKGQENEEDDDYEVRHY